MCYAAKGWGLVRLVCFCAFAIMSNAFGQECKRCSKGEVNIPISLAIGTIQTPVFTSSANAYSIWLEFRRSSLSEVELQCKVGRLDAAENAGKVAEKCVGQPLIDIKWRVLDGDEEIASGSDGGFSEHIELDNKTVHRYIGQFSCETKHKYVVEVTFTKDGSSLKSANPHLAVMPPGDSF
jgi:uncharacterized protein (UPF0212 family)